MAENNGRVTNQMLWDSVRDIGKKVDAVVADVGDMKGDIKVLAKADLCNRMEKMEGWRNKILGVGAVAVVILPTATALVMKYL